MTSLLRTCPRHLRLQPQSSRKKRAYSSLKSKPIISVPPNSKVYAFGAPSQTRLPLLAFSESGWTVNEGEAWAVVSGVGTGGAGKGGVFKAIQTLLGHTRIAPPTSQAQARWAEAGGLYPFLPPSIDPYTRIKVVSFRQRTGGGDGGAFFDYTARYGAMREDEDKVTLRDTLLQSTLGSGSGSTSTEGRLPSKLFDELTEKMGLKGLMDLPIVTLSNGQTRRARVVKAILERPELLLLDEPLTGLDVPSRVSLTRTLQELHEARSPRIMIGLRKGEDVPAWITHVLEVEGAQAVARTVKEVRSMLAAVPVTQKVESSSDKTEEPSSTTTTGEGALLVDMRDVNVAYGARKVLTNINWQIRQGERWHLQGANGSGKTTLLSLLTGDHPQSYTQKHLLLPSSTSSSSSTPSDLEAPSPQLQHRKRTPTALLRRLIGVVSPEMFDAFPRRHPGMSVWEAVSTGFDGGFVPRTKGAGALKTPLGTSTSSSSVKGWEETESKATGGVGWVDVDDDELGLGWDAIEEEKARKRVEVREWRVRRIWEVLEALGPAAWSQASFVSSHSSSPHSSESLPQPSSPSALTKSFAETPFSSLPPGSQRLVLLARALVGRPPVVLLDEVWSGMDADQMRAARRYLRGESQNELKKGVGEDQAVVVITHWEEEVPWNGEEVKRFRL
ncbi:hypothetical protein CVT26_004988 [Gymnopilus dilepis]|uniref:ABC transporter domain-containing protein n=1 Tax=Gymnopilus dilepis TaxID=231916 RepID=A0A409Y049_9AGAR|nr:hypothetical protein CVT26_004988 [Gymnopilus dilepis]